MTARLTLAALLALGLLAACVPETPQPLPADYIPGADYEATPETCAAKGHTMTTDGNGLRVCLP